MEPEALAKLAGSGNSAVVEAEWMRMAESGAVPAEELGRYHVVLAELCRLGKRAQAEALAWAAMEAVQARGTAHDALRVAAPFLLAIGDSPELRAQVTKLYEGAFNDREGLAGLIAESGLPAGRPVRRALRTLEVALSLKTGDYLSARDEDEAARVEAIDCTNWQFTISHSQGTETLGAVHLADRFEPAAATDLRVMRRFAAKELADRIASAPASIIIDLCKRHGNRIDSEKLESLLVPKLISEPEWKKWFTKARAGLKDCPNVKIEGRSPYVILYHDAPSTPEDDLLTELAATRDAPGQVAVVGRYLRECKTRKLTPSEEALRSVYDRLRDHAKAIKPASALDAGLLWLTVRRIGELLEIEGAARGSVEWFKQLNDATHALKRIDDEALSELAVTSFVDARPATWQEELLAMLPTLPLDLCDRAARRLIESGRGAADFDPVVQKVLASPIHHFEALLWLWNGPADEEQVARPASLTLLTRILRTIEDCRRAEHLPKDITKNVNQLARSVLSARKYERFIQCLDNMDPAMAAALKVQLRRLDNLGRSVCDDMLRFLRDRFPPTESSPAVKPWTRDDVLFVTERGLTKKQAEIEYHVNVKMKENAQAIGRAAEHGDLSENSEYKFALEERDLLRARLAQMNAELARARVITPADVPTDHVGIGSNVVLQRVGDGDRYEMTFLGPWEADSASRWFNYLAPLSLELMGKRVGDRVEFNHSGALGTYEIVEIHNALLEQQAPTAV